MTKIPYEQPEFKKTSFNCPFCNAFAKQSWVQLKYYVSAYPDLPASFACFCSHCGKFSIWYQEKMVYPDFAGIEPPNEDLSSNIKSDYEEAGSILQKSPRGAAALLRLCIQKFCKEIGEDGMNISTDIKNLVAKGLPKGVQKSLDIVRVIGNDAVHPGQIDLRDDMETAKVLFKLVNLIAEKMITEPKEVEEIYNILPEGKRQQIEERDGKK